MDAVYRSDSRRVFAALIRLLGDFDLAEDALHDAFKAALEQWPREGVPANPRAWLFSTGRFKAIDGMRRRARFVALPADVAERSDADDPADGEDGGIAHGDTPLSGFAERIDTGDPAKWDGEGIEDDRLRLIFTSCHPALSPDAQVALTLREVCGLTTEEIARAFLTLTPILGRIGEVGLSLVSLDFRFKRQHLVITQCDLILLWTKCVSV